MAEENLKAELRHVGKHFELKEFFQDLKVIKPEKPVGFVEWVQKYTFLKGKPFSFDKHEYQKEILQDIHPLQCIKKSVQIGISEVLIRKFLSFLGMNQGTQGIYTFPTSEDMRNFVKTRFDTVIKDCAKIDELGFNVDNVKVKQIGTSYAHFRGSFGEKETLSIPSDFNCFEKGTEILTAEGWKKIELLTLDDLVATRNPAGKVEWHGPYQLIDKEYEGDLVVFKHQRLELSVTPDHNMFIKKFSSVNIKKNNNEYVLKKAKSLQGHPCFAMTSEAKWHKRIVKTIMLNQTIKKRIQGSSLLPERKFFYSNRYPYIPFCKFLGWFLAEGNVRKLRGRILGQVVLTQTTNTKNSKDIRKVLNELGVKWYENKAICKGFGKQLTSAFVFTDWALAIWLEKLGKSEYKYIPEEILKNSYGLEELLIRLYLGDGMFHKKCREKYGILNTSSKKLADTAQIAWLKLGIRATIRPFKEKSGRIMYRVGPVKCNHVPFNLYTNGIYKGKRKSGRIEKKFYKGKVYCLTVKNHIVMVRGINEKTPIWTGQCHDEIDFSKPNIQNLYRSRLEHSSFKWEINCSTPTIPQYAIDEMFEESDQRHWHVRCNHCGFWQVMTWLPEKGKVDQNSIRIKGNLSAHIDKFDQKLEYIFVCKKCNKPIYYNPDTVKMEWITKHPDRTISRGYFLNALVGWGYKTAGSIIASFYGYKEIDKAYNRILGLAYSDPGRKLSRDNILKCVNRDMELQFVGRNCFLAADQGSPSWVIIGEYDNIKDKIKVLYFEKVENNLFDHVGKGGTVEKGRISELMEKFDVLSAVIDAQPNTESAHAFAKQHPGKVWLCFYSDKQMAKYNWKPDDFVVVANRTRTLDYSVKYWLDKKVEIFPQDNYNYEIYEVMIKHLTSMTKVIDENEDGTRTARWTGPQDTHFAHVWNYLCMATEADSNIVTRIISPGLSGFSMNK